MKKYFQDSEYFLLMEKWIILELYCQKSRHGCVKSKHVLLGGTQTLPSWALRLRDAT